MFLMRDDPGWPRVRLLNPFPAPLEFFFFIIVIIYIFGCLDSRQISLQEEDFLVYQPCYEISSLLGNCAAFALFPHEWAMSEVAAFNICSKFDGSRKSQPAVKHNCLKISLSGDAGNLLWFCPTLQKKERDFVVTAAAKGFSCAQTHWLKLISQTCALLQTGRSSPAGPKTSGSVKHTGRTAEALSFQHIYCCCLKPLF